MQMWLKLDPVMGSGGTKYILNNGGHTATCLNGGITIHCLGGTLGVWVRDGNINRRLWKADGKITVLTQYRMT